MNIGIAGPILIAPFAERLGLTHHQMEELPMGLGGTPVVNLAQGLLDRGHRVVVFTLDPAVTKEVVLEGEQLKMCIGPFRLRRRARDLFSVERAYLREAFFRERPDALHAHWTYEYAMAALDTSLPTLITAHDAPLRALLLIHDAYRAVRTCMAFIVARKARNMTAVSGHVEQHFRRFLRYRGIMDVVPNAVPSRAFELGKRFCNRSCNSTITFATVLSGWSALKNGEIALQAFVKVREKLPGASLWMFGDGYGPEEPAAEWARRNNCADGVVFRGMVAYDQLLADLAARADILVHPSREDACPMAVAEAMALGIPVVGGIRTGGVPELLEHGAAGLLVDITSDTQLAAKLLELAKDSHLRGRLSEIGRHSAQKRFAPRAVAGAYEAILQRLM